MCERTWVLLIPSSRSLVISACRSNSLCAILSSVSAWGKHKHKNNHCGWHAHLAPSTGSESYGHTASDTEEGGSINNFLAPSAGHKNVFVLYVRAVPHSRGRVSSWYHISTIRARQGRRFCFPDQRCVFFNRLRGGKTQAHSPAAPPQPTAGQHSETVTNSSGQAKTSA